MNRSHQFPAWLSRPIAEDVVQESFLARHDGTEQTYLLKDFRTDFSHAPLLVIYLHGAAADQAQGMTPGIFGNAFDRLAVELEHREAVYVCPEYRGGSWMSGAAEVDLAQLLALLREQYHPDKIVLVGGSMGGTSALIFTIRHAACLDGVIALCPATEVSEIFAGFAGQFISSYGGSPGERPDQYATRLARRNARALAQLPIYLVHGTKDNVIPVEHSRILARILRELGAPIHYIEIEEGDHDAPMRLPWSPGFDFVLSKQS